MPRLTPFQKFRLLNTRRGPVLRGLAAVAGSVATLVCSGSMGLAATSARQFWQGDILQGARRVAWLGRRGRLQLRFGRGDHAFDFTDGVPPAQLDILTRFLARHNARNSVRVNATDALFIAARALAHDPAHSREFTRVANDLLQGMPPIKSVVLRGQPDAQGSLSHQDAVAALQDCARLFADIPWFVLSGTYLGLIREGGILPHDYDIDVGVMQDVPLAQITAKIDTNTDFIIRKIDTQPAYGPLDQPRPMLLKLVHRTGVPIDIFYHYPTADGRVVHGSSLHHWFNTPFTLQDYTLEGVPVRGPADADRYLTENYGDWRTPVTDFNCSTDTPNLAIVHHPSTHAMFLQRVARFAETGHANLPRLIAELAHAGIIITTQDDKLALAPDLYSSSEPKF